MRATTGLMLSVVLVGCGGGESGSAVPGDGGAADVAISSGPILGSALELRVRSYPGLPLRGAFLSVPYLRRDVRAHLVNVAVDLNGDGMIAPYAAGAAMQEEWVVRNVPVIPAPTRFGHYFPLGDPAISDGKMVRIKVTLAEAALATAPALGGSDPQAVEAMAAVSVKEAMILVKPAEGYVGQGSGEPFDQWLKESPGTIDVPGGLYQSGYPATPQAPNACVITSIANGLAWLGRRYKFASCLTGTDDIGNMFGTESTEQVQNLASQIDTVGGFGYTPERGVLPPNILPAKNKLVMAMDLPITTTEIDPAVTTTQTNVFDDIASAIARNCVVEIIAVGGGVQHMVNVVGTFNGDLGKSVMIHNGETSTSSFSEVYSVKTTGNMGQIPGFPVNGQPTDVTIARAFIECPSTKTYPAVVLDYDHGPFKAGQKVDLRCITNGHAAGPDACSCMHYHGEGVMITEGTAMSGAIPDNAPMKCGHGCVAPFDITKLDVVCWKPGPASGF
jgi:hypothetical protein